MPGAEAGSPALLPLLDGAVTDAELEEAYRADTLFVAHRDDPEPATGSSSTTMAERTAWRICSTWARTWGVQCFRQPKPERGEGGQRPGPPVHDDLCAVVDDTG